MHIKQTNTGDISVMGQGLKRSNNYMYDSNNYKNTSCTVFRVGNKFEAFKTLLCQLLSTFARIIREHNILNSKLNFSIKQSGNRQNKGQYHEGSLNKQTI